MGDDVIFAGTAVPGGERFPGSAMLVWFTSQFGGFFCFAFSLILALTLIFWRGARRVDCPACHHRNPDYANYCGHCGHHLA